MSLNNSGLDKLLTITIAVVKQVFAWIVKKISIRHIHVSILAVTQYYSFS